MIRLKQFTFLLLLFTPFLLGSVLLYLSADPTLDDVTANIKNGNLASQELAAQWIKETYPKALLNETMTLLEVDDRSIRRDAVEALGMMMSPAALPALDHALELESKEHFDKSVKDESYFEAMYRIGVPSCLPWMAKWAESPEGGKTSREAERYKNRLLTDNYRIKNHFSLGTVPPNQLGEIIHSQAILFPPGKAIIEKSSHEFRKNDEEN